MAAEPNLARGPERLAEGRERVAAGDAGPAAPIRTCPRCHYVLAPHESAHVDGPPGARWCVHVAVESAPHEPSPAHYDRSPLLGTDRGERYDAPKLCCQRVGQWWCVADDGHAGDVHLAPPDRELPPNLFDRGRVRR